MIDGASSTQPMMNGPLVQTSGESDKAEMEATERPWDPGPGPERQSLSRSEDIRPLWIVEKETIEAAIAKCDGNVPRAAAFLGISPSTIYRKRHNWLE